MGDLLLKTAKILIADPDIVRRDIKNSQSNVDASAVF